MPESRRTRSTRAFIPYLIAAILLLALPWIGVALNDLKPPVYLEFPPETVYVQHAPFSWFMFILFSAAVLLLVLSLTYAIFYGAKHKSDGSGQPKKSFPWWGWLGFGLAVLSWILAWTRFDWMEPFQRHTFIPLWFSYIIVINALTVRRNGQSLMSNRPIFFLLLFPFSALFWWFFEYLNRFVQNWFYLGVQNFSAGEYIVFASISFSVVLPAVLSTRDYLLTYSTLSEGLAKAKPLNVSISRGLSLAVLLFSGFGLATMALIPNILFPLLWISPLLIVVSLQYLTGHDTIFSNIKNGDWRNMVAAPLAALICGIFWEMWNYKSLAHWEYLIPYVEKLYIFEMPLLGYAGYLPFGLECLLAAALVERMLDRAK